jgi:hypothetical protein
MASLFIFNRSTSDDDEIRLGVPDLSEAQSLERHVDRCAMRYRMFTKRMIDQGNAIKRIELLAYGIILYFVLTSPIAKDVLGFFLKM